MAKERTLEDVVNREIESARREQSDAVMPLIGPLLDEWEGMPNDVTGMEELAGLSELMQAISRAMDGEDSASDRGTAK